MCGFKLSYESLNPGGGCSRGSRARASGCEDSYLCQPSEYSCLCSLLESVNWMLLRVAGPRGRAARIPSARSPQDSSRKEAAAKRGRPVGGRMRAAARAGPAAAIRASPFPPLAAIRVSDFLHSRRGEGGELLRENARKPVRRRPAAVRAPAPRPSPSAACSSAAPRPTSRGTPSCPRSHRLGFGGGWGEGLGVPPPRETTRIRRGGGVGGGGADRLRARWASRWRRS